MKQKPTKRFYNFQANVFNERIGSQFGRTTSIVVVTNNEKDAYEKAKKSFDRYVKALFNHHNIDGNRQIRKIINTFNYDNLKLV